MALSADTPVNAAADASSRPALALPPRPALRRGLWALPLLLSLLFIGAVLLWLVRTEEEEREQQRQELISDALSLESQVSSRIEEESRLLQAAAERFDAQRHAGRTDAAGTARDLAALPEVQLGLRRFWLSLTWLDSSNRIVAHLPEQGPMEASAQLRDREASGLSAHLSASLGRGGALIARYSPS